MSILFGLKTSCVYFPCIFSGIKFTLFPDFRVHDTSIIYGLGGPSEQNQMSVLINFLLQKIPILCQSLANSAQISSVMSDRTDKFANSASLSIYRNTKYITFLYLETHLLDISL